MAGSGSFLEPESSKSRNNSGDVVSLVLYRYVRKESHTYP